MQKGEVQKKQNKIKGCRSEKNRFRRKSQGSKSGDNAANEGNCDFFIKNLLGGGDSKGVKLFGGQTQFVNSLKQPIKLIPP